MIEIASENNPKEIPPDLQVDAIYEQYMQALICIKRLQPQDSRFLEQDLMPLMFSEDIQQERISVQQIRIAETVDGLPLWDRIFEDKKVGLLRRKNDSFRRLVDAGILMQHVNNDIGFKYERFYDSYGGHRLLEVISSKSEEEKADFYHTLAEDILPLDKAFLWGSVQFALFNELDRDNANLFVDLANRNSQPVKEVVVAALCEYGQKRSSNRDFVTSILERLMHSGASRDRKRRTVTNGQGGTGLTRAMQKTLFARRTAIEVASALEVVEILEEASRDPMPQVRTVAAQYTYYFWRRNPDAAYDVLRLLSQRMQIWGIVPDQTAIETCISLSLVIIFYDQSASVRNALQDIWRDNLDRLLFVPHYDTNIRGWFLAHFREFLITAVTNLTLDYINKLDKDMDVNRVVFTVDEILHFFDLPLEKKARFQRLIKFVDANETNIQDAKEDLLSASRDRDLLTMYLNVMVTAAHILTERESTLEILEAMTDESLKEVPPTPSMVTAPIVLASAIEFDDADTDMRFFDLLRYVNEKNLTLARCRCQAVQEIFFWPGEASYLNLVSSRKGIVDFETANRYFRTVVGKNRHEFDIELLNVFQHFFVRSSTQCGNVAGAVQILLQLVDGDSLPSDKYVREEVQRITLRYLATLWTYDPKEVERALVEADSSDDLRDMIHKTTPHEGFSALISNQFSDFVLESLVRGENQLVIGNIQESLRDVAQRSKPDRKIIRDVMVKAINIVYGEQLLKS